MINHARTLLANQLPFNDFGAYLAEEITPEDFKPVPLPGYLVAARNLLFGGDPDRHMINYRVRQYLTLIHSTPLVEYVYDLDPRVTYAIGGDASLLDNGRFQPVVTQRDGTPTLLYINGVGASPDVSGRLALQYAVQIVSPSTVGITRVQPWPQNQFLSYTLTNGLSQPLSLDASGYTVQLSTRNSLAWDIAILLRPQQDLGTITASFNSIGANNLDRIFGISLVEPFLTFSNLFFTQKQTPLQLAGILLAIIYRTEALRNGISGGEA